MKRQKTETRLRMAVLSLLVILFSSTVWAQRTPVEDSSVLVSGTCGTNASWQVKVTTVLKQKVYSLEISGSGAMTNYTSSANVPWKSYVDTSTGTRVTIDLKSLISNVTISDDITTIGNYAFDGMSKVTSIELPSELTTIGTRAFAGTGIKKVFLPATLNSIAEDAYSDCSNLSFIQFDGSYTASSLSFSGLPSTGRLITKHVDALSSGASHRYTISISGWDRYYHYDQCKGGAWVAYSGSKLYFYAKESGKTVNLATEDFVASANYGNKEYYPWMSKHTTITSLEIDKNISSINDYALDCSMYSTGVAEYGFNNLETITVESGNAAYIVGEDGALYSNDKTALVLYPAKNAATELSIDEAVTTVKDYALSGATNLTSLSFGENVSTIGKYVINNTANLKTITFKGTTAPSFNTTTSFVNHATTGTLYVPSKSNYSTLTAKFPNWTIEDSAGQVGTVRWSYNDGVLTFTGIDALVKSTDWAQYAATTRSIVIGEGITVVNANNFQNFKALESVTVPYSLTEIGSGAFQGSTLKEVNLTLPSGVYSWEVLDQFSQVKNVGALTAGKGPLLLSVNGRQLTESDYITCPAFYSDPDKDAIRYFSNIYNLQLSAMYPQIPEAFFAGWEYLKNVTFVGYNSSLWKINQNAFANSSLESISIPSSVTQIDADAFYNCSNLKNVELHDGVVIGNAAFMYSNIENLKITFHDGVISADEKLRFAYIEDGRYQPFYGATIKHIDICHNVADTEFKDGYALQRWCETSHVEYFKLARPEGGIKLSLNGVEWDETAMLSLPFYMSHTNGALAPFGNVKRLRLPSTLGSTYGIDAREYANHSYLKEVEIPSCVNIIGSSAFAGSGLEKVSILGTPAIADDAFSNIQLKDLTLQDASVAGTKFSNSYYLEHLTLYTGTLADKAFEHCSNLETISVSPEVKIVDGTLPFNDCFNVDNLDAISYWASSAMDIFAKPVWVQLIDIWNNDQYFRKNLLINGVEPKVLTFDMETVPEYSLYRIKNIKNIVLTDKVKAIGDHAIAAPNLEHITCFSDVNNVKSDASDALHSNPQRVTLHITPETQVPTTGIWSKFNVMQNAGPVTLNVCEASIDDESPIQLYAVNTEDAITWSTSGLDCVSVDENGLVTIHQDGFTYDGTTDRYGKVIATTAFGETGEFSVEYTPTSVELTDGNPFFNSKAVDVESVSYTKKFAQSFAGNDKKNKWLPLCVPFSFDVADYADQFEIAELYAFVPLKDTNNSGGIDAGDEHFMVVQKLTSGKTIPCLPYVIRPLFQGECLIQSDNGHLSESKAGAITFSTAHLNFTIQGLLEHSIPASFENKYYYVDANGGVCQRAEGYEPTTVKPNRWYMTVTPRSYGDVVIADDETSCQASFRIVTLGEDLNEDTAIRLVNGDYPSVNNTNDYLYTLEGVRVTNTDNLPSGMYIKNGKKIFLNK